MKKILSHWSIAFVTLIVLTYIGFQDPWVKEILRLKSFDYVLQNEVKTPSESVSIVTIDEQQSRNMVNGRGNEMYLHNSYLI